MGAKLDLVFLVSSIIEMTAGLITLFEPEMTFDAIGHGMGRQAARAWGAAVLSFGLAIYLGWRGTRSLPAATAVRFAQPAHA